MALRAVWTTLYGMMGYAAHYTTIAGASNHNRTRISNPIHAAAVLAVRGRLCSS